MNLVARNAPCPCGSGIKHKKCCLHRHETGRRESTELIIPRSGFATRRAGKPLRLPEASDWPVERVFVPVRDIGCATGMGTVAVVRRRRDGRLAHGAFVANLSE